MNGVEHLLVNSISGVKISTYESGLSLLADLDAEVEFDVVITDLAMKDINGLGLIRAIRARRLSVPVIVLSASEDAVTRANADAASAFCFLHKSVDEAALVAAINAATSAERLQPGDMRKAARRSYTDAQGNDQVVEPKLSKQQRRILNLIATGAKNAEIADQLSISENTVKSHVKAIFRELGVKTRTAAAQRGRELAMF